MDGQQSKVTVSKHRFSTGNFTLRLKISGEIIILERGVNSSLEVDMVDALECTRHFLADEGTSHSVEYEPFTKSQLISRNQV